MQHVRKREQEVKRKWLILCRRLAGWVLEWLTRTMPPLISRSKDPYSEQKPQLHCTLIFFPLAKVIFVHYSHIQKNPKYWVRRQVKSCGARQAGNLKDKGLQLNKSKCKELHCKMVFAEGFGKLRNKARALCYRFYTDFRVQIMH